MNSRTLLVLTILVAVLGAFIFFFEKDTLSTDERREQEKKAVVLEKDDVVGLDVTWGENRVRFERQDPPPKDEDEDEKGDIFAEPEAEWRLVEPLDARADKSAVESLLTTLTTLEKERTLEGASRSETGLDEPRGKVTLTTEKGETVVEIGPELPASSDMIVAVGDAILQVPGSVWVDLTKEPGEWRDKKLFTANRTQIERLTLGGRRAPRCCSPSAATTTGSKARWPTWPTKTWSMACSPTSPASKSRRSSTIPEPRTSVSIRHSVSSRSS